MNKIRAIIFDLVGVLVFKNENYISKTKEQLNAEKIEKLYNHLDDRKLLSDIKEKLGLTIKEIEEALPHIPQKYEKNKELWTLLPNLKKQYKLAIINNGNNIAWRYWQKRFDFSIFDFFVNSAAEGVKKPDPRIYLIAFKKLKFEPKECLFVDDLKENIKTAEQLGMETIWWEKNKAEESFKKFNVKTRPIF